MSPRRDFLTACGALALAGQPVAAADFAADDPHVAWWNEERRLLAAFEAEDDEARSEALNDRRWEIRELIVDTPAVTLAGVAAQVRLMAEYDYEGMEPYSDLYEMLERVADRLDHLAGRI